MDLEQLITNVEETGSDPLEQVSVAAMIKGQIDALGDELLDHFVGRARTEGFSWTQIGEALGVTRQAAQQRHGGFVERALTALTQGKERLKEKFPRFTKRARAAVVAAQTAARERRHPTIDTEHVLLGLFGTGERNVATEALGRLELDAPTVERLVDEKVPRGEREVRGHMPFSPLAEQVFETTLNEALRLGHNYVGTEHILLALRRADAGVANQVLADREISYDDLRTTVLDILRGAV